MVYLAFIVIFNSDFLFPDQYILYFIIPLLFFLKVLGRRNGRNIVQERAGKIHHIFLFDPINHVIPLFLFQ